MALLYYWKDFHENVRDGAELRSLRLYQQNPIFGERKKGETVWAITRDGKDRYVIVAKLVVVDSGIDAVGGGSYGKYFVEADPSRSLAYETVAQASIAPLIRSLAVSANADKLGMSFQGKSGVKALSDEDNETLEEFARGLTVVTSFSGRDWSIGQLEAAVDAYERMLRLETAGKSFNKARFNQQLRDGPLRRRTKSAVEYRMQNISAVLQDFGANWIRGYRPADSVGKGVRSNIARLLFKRGMISAPHTEPTADPTKLDEFVSKIRSTQGKGILGKHPAGQKKPRKTLGSVVSYVRDPEVKAWVLEKADGICEGCHLAAPFVDGEGNPFLEVHHVVPLAEEGPDTVENAVAVCPNCHRHLHYGADRLRTREALYKKVARLTKPDSIISSIRDDSCESPIKHARGLDDEANP